MSNGAFLQKGDGWRLGWNSNASTYKAMLGGQDWAIELNEREFADFCRLFGQLVDTIESLQNELMDEEKINCELESDLIYLLADGYPDSYCLRILLNQGRRAEGNWSSLAVTQLNAALKSFLTSGQK
ncbi:MAG: DUF1818 family protein [Cyanobacteriota bacterium ELA615]